MTIVPLDKAKVEGLFSTFTDQADVLIAIYRMVIPDWDRVRTIHSWPAVSRNTWVEISGMFQKFDKVHHPGVLPGGCWMNHGFSSSSSEGLMDWTVDLSTCEVILDAESRQAKG